MNQADSNHSKPKTIEQATLIAKVESELSRVFVSHFPNPIGIGLSEDQVAEIKYRAISKVLEDLSALSNKDPAAARGGPDYVLQSYTSLRAVMYYRLANAVYYLDGFDEQIRHQCARQISEEGKIRTLVEIHPAAIIGCRFVVDHGVATVIGETCEIGDDCYILQGVVLGSKGIASNPQGKRHPVIGSNVEIGSYARLFGPIKIGHHVIISPHCVITNDVPDNTVVGIINQLQFSKTDGVKKKVQIYGIVPCDNSQLIIYGENLEHCTSIKVLDERYEHIFETQARLISVSNKELHVELSCITPFSEQKAKSPNLELICESEQITITQCQILGRCLRKLASSLRGVG